MFSKNRKIRVNVQALNFDETSRRSSFSTPRHVVKENSPFSHNVSVLIWCIPSGLSAILRDNVSKNLISSHNGTFLSRTISPLLIPLDLNYLKQQRFCGWGGGGRRRMGIPSLAASKHTFQRN